MLHAENAVEDFKLSRGDELGTSFGLGVAVSDDVVLVGAPADTGAALPEAGAAYIYRRDGSNWPLEEKLTDPNGQENDFFGLSVALSGAVAIVGAPADDDFGEPGDEVLLESGSAFVFRYNGATWDLEQKLTASDAAGSDLFGFSVAISGNVAIVGADEAQDGPGGSAYVFRYDGATWNEEAILKGKPGADDNFGISVAISGEVAVVGASPAAETPKSGSAYVFRHTGGGAWTNEAELTPSVRINGDRFGEGVAISGTRTIVAAPGVSEAYIYHNTSGTIWSETKLIDSNPSPGGNNYGFSVAISGEVALVTAPTKPRTGSENVGSGFLYRLTDTGWSESELLPSDSPAATSGWSAALSQDYGLLGTLGDTGAAYIYNLAPEISWPTPAPIAVDTPLSGVQLNASAGDIPGTFNYSAPLSEVLPPGRTTVTADFTPTDTARYAPASKKATILVFTAIDAFDDLLVLPIQPEWVGAGTVPERRFLPLENDQFTDHSSTAGYMLRLRKVENVEQLSKTGESIITVALVGGDQVHIRIFDGAGALAFDVTESDLIRGQIVDAIRQTLQALPGDYVPSAEDTADFIAAAAYLTGFSPGIHFVTDGFKRDTMVTPGGATAFTNGREIRYINYQPTADDDSFIYHLRDGEQTDDTLITIRRLIPSETSGWGDYGPAIGGWLALAGRVSDSGSSSLGPAVDLFRDSPDEFYAMAVNYSSLGGGVPFGYDIGARSGNQVAEGLLLRAFRAVQSSLVDLIIGEGESTVITAEMAEISRAFVEAMVASSSDIGLSEKISTALEIDDAALIGMSFSQFAAESGVDAGQFELRVMDYQVALPSFSLTTLYLDGISYSLTKSTTLASGSPVPVVHTATIDPAGTITLTDPNASGDKAFYQIVSEKTPNTAATAGD